jgi:hypothetical protein
MHCAFCFIHYAIHLKVREMDVVFQEAYVSMDVVFQEAYVSYQLINGILTSDFRTLVEVLKVV